MFNTKTYTQAFAPDATFRRAIISNTGNPSPVANSNKLEGSPASSLRMSDQGGRYARST